MTHVYKEIEENMTVGFLAGKNIHSLKNTNIFIMLKGQNIYLPNITIFSKTTYK